MQVLIVKVSYVMSKQTGESFLLISMQFGEVAMTDSLKHKSRAVIGHLFGNDALFPC